MRKWRWNRWLVCIAIAATLFLSAWSLINPRRHDPYPFLARHNLVEVGVQGPGTWGPTEIRTYTWKQPWQAVANLARHELPSFGLSEQKRKKREGAGATWLGGEIFRSGLEGTYADLTVEIVPGRSQPLRYRGRPIDEDPQWVTVVVQSNLEENWINIIRYTCFPIRD